MVFKIWINEKRDNKQCLLDTPRRLTVNIKRLISKCNQSRTNGPINAHLTIAQVMPKNNHNNEKFLQNICSSTAINSTTKLFVNAINMYVTFNLLILEKQTSFENSLFMLSRQPIKLRESDKSLITVKNYSINISGKITFYYPL